MPLQNRVDPFGNLFRTSARGTFMGNRGGVIHDGRREIVRPYKSPQWIACVLEFKGRHRVVMTPRRYTELFFLDEAVALAAGHRPCAECRRQRFNAFREAWQRAQGGPVPRAGEMDAVLHPARIDRCRAKVTWQAKLNSLPDGCFVEIEGSACLIWRGSLLPWTPDGYEHRKPRPEHAQVTVLSPRPIVECLRHGYVPDVHPTVTG